MIAAKNLNKTFLIIANCCIALSLGLLVLVPASIAAPKEPLPSLVAHEGDTAPDSGGATFFFGCDADPNLKFIFDEPMVNASGDVAFIACLSNGAGFYYKPQGQALQKIDRTGDTIGIVGTLNGGFDGPAISKNGTVIFAGDSLSGGTATAALFEKKTSSQLTPIVKQGDSAPGTTSGVFSSFDDIAINDNEAVAFIGSYTEDGGSTFKAGIFLREDNGTITNIIKDGDSLPGGGGTVDGAVPEDFDGPWLNNNGDIAFTVDSVVGTAPPANSLFIRRSGQAVQTFILIGDKAPGPKGNTINSVAIGRPGLTDNDTVVALLEFTKGLDKAIAAKTLGKGVKLRVKNGAHAADTKGIFGDLSNPVITGDGTIVFRADIVNDASNLEGAFSSKGSMKPVVVLSDPRPAGGSWGNIEEVSAQGRWVTWLDEVSGGPGGVFEANLDSTGGN